MNAIARREIESECSRIALLASNLMDMCEFDRMVELFTEDCEFVRPSTYPNGALNGRSGILNLVRTRPKDLISRHILSNTLVDAITETRATGKAYFLHFAGHRESSAQESPLPIAKALRSVGEYIDHFVLTPDGWRIAKRVGRFIFGGI